MHFCYLIFIMLRKKYKYLCKITDVQFQKEKSFLECIQLKYISVYL